MHNKQPKDPRLCKILRKAVTMDRKRNGFDWEDIANELGLNGGTLENKLKPSYDNGDITLSEFMHFMEMSADFTALEYIATKFDMNLVPKVQQKPTSLDLNVLVDLTSISQGEVFKEIKEDLSDDVIDADEREKILEKINTLQKTIAKLKDRVNHANADDTKAD